MKCGSHEKYTGYRRPSNGCHSCWRVYLDEKDLVLLDYIKSIASKSPDVAKYLIANQTKIMVAPVIQEAKVMTSIQFADVEELIEDGFGENLLDLEDVDAILPIAEELVEELEEIVLNRKPQRGRFV